MSSKPKLLITRKNLEAMQRHCINKLALSDFHKRALKRATTWYAQEKDKPKGLSLYQILQKVKKEYNGIRLHATTIQKYVKANIAGMSPLKPGVKGDVPPWAFKSLCIAFRSYVCIQEINSPEGEITFKKLLVRINKVLKHYFRQKMLQQLLFAMAKNLDASMMHIAEDRRVRWTTYANISSWVEILEFNLADLGFAAKGTDGKVMIPERISFVL
jgi:hypothetical protein